MLLPPPSKDVIIFLLYFNLICLASEPLLGDYTVRI